MAHPSELEARVAALEARMNEGGPMPRPRGHLAAARDRDLADLTVTVDANRSAITALGEQTADRFARLQQKVDYGFTEMRGTLDQTAAGQQQIAELLNTLIAREGDE